ncbi:MAG: YbaN family protein [Prevotella sp.]
MFAGSTAVVLGGIGLALPILPTTPFVILAALCFSYSNPKMYKWLANSKYFGEYIENYRTGAGVSKKTKTYAVISLWSMLCISALIMRDNIWVIAILLVVGICVSTHLILLRERPLE